MAQMKSNGATKYGSIITRKETNGGMEVQGNPPGTADTNLTKEFHKELQVKEKDKKRMKKINGPKEGRYRAADTKSQEEMKK